MVQPSTYVVLLTPVGLQSLVPVPCGLLLRVLPRGVVVVLALLVSLHNSLGTVASIMARFSTLKTSTWRDRSNRDVGPHWNTSRGVLAVLLSTWLEVGMLC